MAILLGGTIGTVGCDWVDSAGNGGNRPPESEIVLDDQPAEGPITLLERASVRIFASATDTDGAVKLWRWSDEPVFAGDLSACAGVDGFNPDYVADSLEAACTSGGCTLQFSQQALSDDGNVAEFSLDVPILKAPVGVTYTLSAIDDDGAEGTSEYTFCLIAVNEAPTAVDDDFTVEAGSELVVTAEDRNLLSNDADDIDVSNQPLSVLTEAVRLPAAAATFELGDDGGFVYRFAGIDPRTEVLDSFDYAVTDGRSFSTATVSLRIAADTAPVISGAAGKRGTLRQSQNPGDAHASIRALDPPGVQRNKVIHCRELPLLMGRKGEAISIDVSAYCRDPEAEQILYELEAAPVGHALAIGRRSGLLDGVFSEAGTYRFGVRVADGRTPPIHLPVVIEIEDS